MKISIPARLGTRGPLGRPRRLGGILLASILTLAAFATPVLADSAPADDASSAAVVKRHSFTEPDATLSHNIPDLSVTIGDDEVACNFLTNYQTTGGLTRWGFATSEVIAERPGSLTQYYQRGIVDCQERDGVWRLERRLVWDLIGGGLGDSPDLGTEPDIVSEQPGLPLGPWGHRVSNFAVDGTPTGFLDFFNQLGGLQAFGLPKTEARLDDAPGAMLGIEEADAGVIRQYFQAAILEHRPGSPEPVQLRFLGDEARDVLYPFGSHQSFQSFLPAEPLRYGQRYVPEGTSVRDALGAIYHATDGDNWSNNRNWMSDAPLGEWFGVTTDDQSRVVDLDLSQNQLRGELPPAIGRLTDLQELFLWGNQLSGPIPPELGHLGNLAQMYIWANQFSGTIPPELGSLANLERLVLGINELSGPIPPELGNLSSLTHMDLTLNQLSGAIPPELGNLTWLVLWSNRLEGEIPVELGQLTELTRVDFDFNRLSGEIPVELANLTQLDTLYLSVNRLTGEIPAELGTLANLGVLSLHENQLTGEIPAELANLENLRRLLLANNALTGCVPASLFEVGRNDLDELGLPLCDVEEETPAPA